MSKKSFLVSAFCLPIVIAASPAHAASVVWSAPTTISGDSDVSTTGSLVSAYNFGAPGVGSATVNGVTFQEFAVDDLSLVTVGSTTLSIETPGMLLPITILGSASAPFANLSTGYQTLLGSAVGAFNAPILLTMSALSVGETYQFQWWANESGVANLLTSTAIAGNSVTLAWNATNAEGGVGQFAIGTFIADATTQQISFPDSASAASLINGFQLRQTSSTPSPVPDGGATAALLALSMLGLVAIRRRKL